MYFQTFWDDLWKSLILLPPLILFPPYSFHPTPSIPLLPSYPVHSLPSTLLLPLYPFHLTRQLRGNAPCGYIKSAPNLHQDPVGVSLDLLPYSRCDCLSSIEIHLKQKPPHWSIRYLTSHAVVFPWVKSTSSGNARMVPKVPYKPCSCFSTIEIHLRRNFRTVHGVPYGPCSCFSPSEIRLKRKPPHGP